MARRSPLALAARVWLVLGGLGALVDVVSTAAELRLLRAIESGAERVTPSLRLALEDAAARSSALGWVRLALFVPAALVFLVWLARIVERHRAALGITPTRAVVEYFVPIAQLALPYRTMGRLLAAASVPDTWTRFLWWSGWLVALLTAQLSRAADASALDVSGFVQAAWLALASALASVLSAFAAERLVRRLDA